MMQFIIKRQLDARDKQISRVRKIYHRGSTFTSVSKEEHQYVCMTILKTSLNTT